MLRILLKEERVPHSMPSFEHKHMKRILNGEKALGVSGGAGISGEELPNLFINLNGVGWRAKNSTVMAS